MRHSFRNYGLSIVLFGVFLLCEGGLSFVGQHHYNQEQLQHGQPQLGYFEYLASASFMEATMENWESEFLQMFGYVLLTAFLYQRGSAESRKLDEPEPVDRDPRLADKTADTPWPVRRGGLVLTLYENSLSIGLFCSSPSPSRGTPSPAPGHIASKSWRTGGLGDGGAVSGRHPILV
jgi:hypothetical protein